MKKELMQTVTGLAMGVALGIAWFTPLAAATLTVGGPGTGTALNLDPADFAGSGPCGSGESVVGDGCSVVVKNDPSAPHAYGRFDPLGGNWIDSQDLSVLRWGVESDFAFTSLSFAITDAHDQPNSYFTVEAAGASWSTSDRLDNGNLLWFTLLLDDAVRSVEVLFSTRHNDGFGVSAVSAIPIPLPAAGWLLLAGVGALALHRRRRVSGGV